MDATREIAYWLRMTFIGISGDHDMGARPSVRLS